MYILYCMEKKPCAHKCRPCARFLVHRGFLELCAGLVRGPCAQALCARGCAQLCAQRTMVVHGFVLETLCASLVREPS